MNAFLNQFLIAYCPITNQAEKSILVSCPPGVSNPRPVAHMQPRRAMNTAWHKIVILLETLFCSSVFISVCIFYVWPKTTLLRVWPRDSRGWTLLDTMCFKRNRLFSCQTLTWCSYCNLSCLTYHYVGLVLIQDNLGNNTIEISSKGPTLSLKAWSWT